MIKLVRTYIFFTLQKSSRTHFNLSKISSSLKIIYTYYPKTPIEISSESHSLKLLLLMVHVWHHPPWAETQIQDARNKPER